MRHPYGNKVPTYPVSIRMANMLLVFPWYYRLYDICIRLKIDPQQPKTVSKTAQFAQFYMKNAQFVWWVSIFELLLAGADIWLKGTIDIPHNVLHGQRKQTRMYIRFAITKLWFNFAVFHTYENVYYFMSLKPFVQFERIDCNQVDQSILRRTWTYIKR